ncbi:MAG: hypothetical protein HY207_01130 [Nitrospirae bacterium]|nr:hypothetical protein [Nitrospirota bacterium]
MEEAFEPIKQAVIENRLHLAIIKTKARRLLTWPRGEERRWVPVGRMAMAQGLGILFIVSSLAGAYFWTTWELMRMIVACTLSLVSLRYLDRIAAHHVQELAMTDEAFFRAGRDSGLIELEQVKPQGADSKSQASAY